MVFETERRVRLEALRVHGIKPPMKADVSIISKRIKVQSICLIGGGARDGGGARGDGGAAFFVKTFLISSRL